METELSCGYYTLTYRFRLIDADWQLLAETKKIYNHIISFYYDLYSDFPSLHTVPKGSLMREMEKLTFPGRDGTEPRVSFPYKKVPLYFRRAAINAAIAAVKQEEERNWKRKKPDFNVPPTFYKGMYRDFSTGCISLKLWNGEKWQWYTFKLQGHPWPENGRQMSPMVVLNPMNRNPMLHVPVQMDNSDARKIRDKFQQNVRVCGVCFTNEDAFAVCSEVRSDGTFGKSLFCRGGNQYRHQCRQVVIKIEKSKRSVGCAEKSRDPVLNKRYWRYLKNLSEHYAHQVSHQIITFCKEQQISVIALPDYEKHYSNYVLSQNRKWTPLYLSIQIQKKLEYKAWSEGISIARVRYYKSAGKSENGNRYLRTARNIGKQCLKNHGVLQEDRKQSEVI